MELYVVITVFQGVFDAIEPFKTEKEADDYAEKLKAEFGDDEDLDITKKRLEIP